MEWSRVGGVPTHIRHLPRVVVSGGAHFLLEVPLGGHLTRCLPQLHSFCLHADGCTLLSRGAQTAAR